MLIKKDIFNSENFAMSMGNIILDDTCEVFLEEFDLLLEYAREEGYKHLSIRIPTTQKMVLTELYKRGFYLVDTLVEFLYEGENGSIDRPVNVTFREFKKSDIDSLKDIAKNSFKLDRYHSDINLDNSLCDNYYEKWIENSCNGFADGVTVAEKDGCVCGFFSYKTYLDDPYGHLVLGAVDEKFRGNGIFPGLIVASRDLMLKQHSVLKGVKVGTQLVNISAMRAYAKAGFKLYDSFFVLHKYVDIGE